jgi:hypothetical protein
MSTTRNSRSTMTSASLTTRVPTSAAGPAAAPAVPRAVKRTKRACRYTSVAVHAQVEVLIFGQRPTTRQNRALAHVRDSAHKKGAHYLSH